MFIVLKQFLRTKTEKKKSLYDILQGKNTELCQSIHNERETCMELQVQIQMIERKKSRPTREKMPERTQEIKTEVRYVRKLRETDERDEMQ